MRVNVSFPTLNIHTQHFLGHAWRAQLWQQREGLLPSLFFLLMNLKQNVLQVVETSIRNYVPPAIPTPKTEWTSGVKSTSPAPPSCHCFVPNICPVAASTAWLVFCIHIRLSFMALRWFAEQLSNRFARKAIEKHDSTPLVRSNLLGTFHEIRSGTLHECLYDRAPRLQRSNRHCLVRELQQAESFVSEFSGIGQNRSPRCCKSALFSADSSAATAT